VPTYSYQCKRCAQVQDVFHSMSQTPKIKCEACGGPCTRLLGSGAGIIFKGSGFYETDYKNKGKKPAAEAAKPASESKSSSNGESAKTTPTSSDKKAS
jgi:putative FmdB family regulatory protein